MKAIPIEKTVQVSFTQILINFLPIIPPIILLIGSLIENMILYRIATFLFFLFGIFLLFSNPFFGFSYLILSFGLQIYKNRLIR